MATRQRSEGGAPGPDTGSMCMCAYTYTCQARNQDSRGGGGDCFFKGVNDSNTKTRSSKMPFYIRKQHLEIPPPSEKDWIKKDEEEDFYLKDPDQAVDSLPQPYRMINKLLVLLFEQAWEIIAGRDRQEIKKQLLAPTLYQPSARFQVVGRTNCLAASGDYIFIGLSTGLSVFSMSLCEKLCSWEAARVEVCAIQTSDLGNGSHLLGSVDEMGIARLFYFIRENLLHIKAINEVEDVSKRNTCVELELSRGGDYAGFLLQGSSEAWLEIYRLPKDSWLKELEHIQTFAVTVPVPTSVPTFKEMKNPDLQASAADIMDAQQEVQQLLSKAESRLSPPALTLKVRSPKPLGGSIFKSPFEALMKCDDGNVVGLGQNHMIKQCQWEWQEALFNSTFQQYLEIENEQEAKEEKPSHAMFHFHLSGRTLQAGTETKAEPDTPIAFSVHWSRSNNLCFYLLSRPPKEKMDSDPKPDIVWPCASPITCSAVTPCLSYLAFACEDGTITIWDKSLGFPLAVTVLREEYVVRSIQFMPLPLPPGEKTTFSSKSFAGTKVQLLVLCTDGSLHLITSGAKEFSTKLLRCRPESPSQTISAVATIPTLPNAVLIFYWEGTVGLMDTAMQETICHFIPPPLHKVASPWQPVFSVDTDGQFLILRGDEQPAGGTADTETIFLFDFKSYPFMESLAEKADLPLDYLPWDRQCNIFLGDSLQRLSTISQQMPECWSQLQTYAATLQRARQEK
ncbi:WD repeat-containing protein 93 [Tiliqua scincoides]|uniref:WD repeat-containing protein 93 n=1 Tax=Tiliqua scincoides TaxID=71010 RepID=UPI0034629012